MICTKCKTNKVDGKKETLCPSCKDSEQSLRNHIKKHDDEILTKIEAIVSEVVTETTIQEITTRLHGLPLHQMITKLIAYEILSSGYGVSVSNGKISANILDAFILSKELKSVTSSVSQLSDVTNVIERKIGRNWNLKV